MSKVSDVIESFVLGASSGSASSSVSIEQRHQRRCLLSYATVIAFAHGDVIIVNNQRYSATTSRQQRLLLSALRMRARDFVEVLGEHSLMVLMKVSTSTLKEARAAVAVIEDSNLERWGIK